MFLLDSFKRLLTETGGKGLEVSETDKALIGGIVLEHLVGG